MWIFERHRSDMKVKVLLSKLILKDKSWEAKKLENFFVFCVFPIFTLLTSFFGEENYHQLQIK